jgi:hypothetical protein
MSLVLELFTAVRTHLFFYRNRMNANIVRRVLLS